MSLRRVTVTAEVFSVCTIHALTTDSEEIMGLLLGEVSEDGGAATVWGVSVQCRSDKRKDRVEIPPEAMVASSEEAEQLAGRLGRPTRVVGWYHSHPHITVQPSHVDVRTQHSLQAMDAGFVGLIFSVFGRSGRQGGRMQLTAFQARTASERRDVPVEVRPTHEVLRAPEQAQAAARAVLQNLVRLQRTLLKEERDAYHRHTFDFDGAGDEDGTRQPRTRRFPSGVLSPAFAGPGGAPRSAEDEAKGEDDIDQLYAGRKAPVRHPLAALHNAGVYQQALSKLLEYGCLPALQALEHTARVQRAEADALRAENARLEEALAAASSEDQA